MNVKVVCDWLGDLPFNVNRPTGLVIDKFHIFPSHEENMFRIFYVCEPSVILGSMIPWVLENHQHFDVVMTHDDRLLNVIPNARNMHWTRSMILEKEYDVFSYNDKKFQVSFICGGKLFTHDHYKRRECWDRQKEITIPKRMFHSTAFIGSLQKYDTEPLPRESKLPAFIDSMFHIAIENCQIKGYFSEKLVDCFVSRTVPIYLGCPNIGDFFDVRGIIIAKDVDDIIRICNNLTEEDFHSRKEFVEKNRIISLEKYPNDIQKGLYYHMKDMLESNNLTS